MVKQHIYGNNEIHYVPFPSLKRIPSRTRGELELPLCSQTFLGKYSTVTSLVIYDAMYMHITS
jgi:hypothetical protein